jgi:peptidoglycan/LPS O-acetylase OafA/YrhL
MMSSQIAVDPAAAQTAPAHASTSERKELAYRPALDGLRAFAVLSVIGYHLGLKQLQGGFVGVDLFFVLSGYLITSLLLREYRASGAIDLPQFWLRRAKRLLPALFVVLVATAVWVARNARPFELPLRRMDLFWTLFYGSNWHFIASAQDYFAQSAAVSPVRHTWSLAIEEQFYLAWPLIVVSALALARRRTWLLGAVVGAGVVASGVAMAVLFTPGDPSRAYYGTDTRIHQPLIGALLAVVCSWRAPRALIRNGTGVAIVGAVAVASAAMFLSDHNPAYWNGVSVLLACAGALLVLGVEAAPDGTLARGLSRQPFRWIGQISYGLYLWHWPVILAVSAPVVLLRWLPEPWATNVTRVALTFGIASTSFYLVEQPVRRNRLPIIRSSPLRFVAATGFATLLVGIALARSTSGGTAEVAAQDIPGCPASGDEICVRAEGPRGAPVLAVTGDSIARSLDPAFLKIARDHGWTYLLAAKNACRITHLLTSFEGEVRPFDQQCYETTPRVTRRLLRWRPDLIVAIDRWEIMDFVGPDGKPRLRGTPEHVRITRAALADAARELTSNGSRLAFFVLPPALNGDCGSKIPLTDPGCNVPVADDPAQAPYNDAFRQVASEVPGVTTISVNDAVCPQGTCVSRVNGLVVRFDGLHFSPDASVWLAPTLYAQLVASGIASAR